MKPRSLLASGRACVSCSSLGGVDEVPPAGPSSLSFQLCVSQLPDPEVGEWGCGDVDVQYVVVKG